MQKNDQKQGYEQVINHLCTTYQPLMHHLKPHAPLRFAWRPQLRTKRVRKLFLLRQFPCLFKISKPWFKMLWAS